MKFKKLFSILLIAALTLPCFVIPARAQDSSESTEELSESAVFAEITGARGGARAIVSMTYDDGQYETAAWMNEMFAKYDLRASCMLVLNKLSTEKEQEKFRAIFEKGYLSPENHSMTHKVLPGTEWSNYEANKQNNTPENYQRELIDSKTLLESMFGQPSITFAASNNTLYTDAAAVVMDTYYAMRKGVRGKVQSFNPIEGSDAPGGWYNLYMRGIDNSTLEQNKSYVQLCIDQGGWFISMTHAVINDSDDPTKPERFEAFYQYLSEKQANGEIWVTTFAEATKYLRERQNSEVLAYTDGEGIRVGIKMSDYTGDGLPLTPEIFNVPLTVKVEVPKHWSAVKCTAGDKNLYKSTFTESGRRFVLVDIVPNGEEINLSAVNFAGKITNPAKSGSIAGDGTYTDGVLAAGEAEYSYVAFDVPENEIATLENATINFSLSSEANANVSIFGLLSEHYGGDFASSPGIIPGVGVDTAAVFGGEAIWSGAPGGTSINVIDYVKGTGGKCTFLIVAEQGTENTACRFDSVTLTLSRPVEYDFSKIEPKVSMRLSSTFELCFYINALSDICGAYSDGRVYFDENSEPAEIKDVDGESYYVLPVSFSIYELKEKLSVTALVDTSDGYVITKDYSYVPMDYVDTILADKEYRDERQLILDIFSYIRAVMKYEDSTADLTEINSILYKYTYFDGSNTAMDMRVFSPDKDLIKEVGISLTETCDMTFIPADAYLSEKCTVSFRTGGIDLDAQRLDDGSYRLRLPIHLISRRITLTLTDGEGKSAVTEYNLRYTIQNSTDTGFTSVLERLANLSESALKYQAQK